MKKTDKKKLREGQKEANRKAILTLQVELRQALANKNQPRVKELTERIQTLRGLC